MKQLTSAIFLVVFLLLSMSAYGQAKTIIIWKWIDGSGKSHYTDNFNSIPAAYKNSAVQGTFAPEKPLTSNSNPNNGRNGKTKPKYSNKLEIFDTLYYESDDMLVVTGKVRNGFAQPISNIKIKITFLDKQDNLLRSETSFIEPIQLQSGEQGKFKIEIPPNQDIEYYKIDVISE